MADIPPPPAGFDLDAPPGKVPPPPAGFTFDSPPPPPNRDTGRPHRYGQRVEAAGKVLDRQLGTGVSGVLKAGVAAGEVAEQMLTGPIADVAGAATSVLTQDPKKGESVRKAIQTEPATSYGRAASDYVATIAEPLSKILDIPQKKLEKYWLRSIRRRSTYPVQRLWVTR
jgi:hypothetical protein